MEYEIIEDKTGSITDWVCAELQLGRGWLGKHITFGFSLCGKLIGGIIFHDYRPDIEIWWTIYTTDKRWCNRRLLKFLFSMAFNYLKCRRISLSVSQENQNCINLVKKLGFKQEGLLRNYRDDGTDGCIFGMLKSECKWIKQEKKHE